jgi:hypothetical protein
MWNSCLTAGEFILSARETENAKFEFEVLE